MKALGAVGLMVLALVLSIVFWIVMGFLWQYLKPVLKVLGFVFLLICAVGMIFAPEVFGAVGYFAVAIVCFLVARFIFAVLKGLSS